MSTVLRTGTAARTAAIARCHGRPCRTILFTPSGGYGGGLPVAGVETLLKRTRWLARGVAGGEKKQRLGARARLIRFLAHNSGQC